MQLHGNWMGAEVLYRPPFEKLLNADHLLLLVALCCSALYTVLQNAKMPPPSTCCTTLLCTWNEGIHTAHEWSVPKCHFRSYWMPCTCCTMLHCTLTAGSHTALQNTTLHPLPYCNAHALHLDCTAKCQNSTLQWIASCGLYSSSSSLHLDMHIEQAEY